MVLMVPVDTMVVDVVMLQQQYVLEVAERHTLQLSLDYYQHYHQKKTKF